MHKTLFIVSAGLSTRFNGKPKHLAKIKGTPNIEHTLQLARKWYNDIFIALNEKASKESIIDTQNIAKLYDANLVLIPSGKGDADAVYQTLEKLRFNLNNVSVCWGDAWFKNETVFKQASKALDEKTYDDVVFDAMCAMEHNPYGWFNLSASTLILDATFENDINAKNIAKEEYAAHDQCFFNINVKNFKDLYKKYVCSIELKKKILESNFESCASIFKLSLKYEISWYKMINWSNSAYNDPSSHLCSIATILDEPIVMSFNTEEDLEKINNA